MSNGSPSAECLRELLSRRSGRIVSVDGVREAAENLLGLVRLVREWDRKARGTGAEFENSEVRGVAGVPAPAYAPAASGPRRAAQ